MDKIKMQMLELKNEYSQEQWNEFINWLIDEMDFPVAEYFNLEYEDD